MLTTFAGIAMVTCLSSAAIPLPPPHHHGAKNFAGAHGDNLEDAACCWPDGGCTELRIQECIAQGGVPHPGADCGNTECFGGGGGACCVAHMGGIQSCIVVPQPLCNAIGGDYQGDGADCQGDPGAPPLCGQPTHACCLPDGFCAELTPHDCLMQGGQPNPAASCGDIDCNGGPVVGACCVMGGGILGCIVASQSDCGQLGGEYQGDGTDCSNNPTHPPPCGGGPTLACCLDDGSCAELPLDVCLNSGGMPHNTISCAGVACPDNPSVGACCVNVPGAPGCIIASADLCDQLGGTYQGDGTSCQGNPMDPPPCGSPTVPCCLPSPLPEGICLELPLNDCIAQGGQPHQAPSCDFVPCMGGPDIGACCVMNGGFFACVMVPEGVCGKIGGEFQGAGTHCGDPNTPPPCGEPVVACCLPDGTCVEISFHQCIMEGGQPNPAGTCGMIDCSGGPHLGACCLNVPGVPGCIITSAAECEQLVGTYQGDGTDCMGGPNEPPPCGSTIVPCCLPAPLPEGICLELPLEQCIAEGGQPHRAPSCAFVQCLGGPRQGACCVSTPGIEACIETSPTECEQFGGEYLGDGTHCNGNPMDPSPCGGSAVACCLPNGGCEELPLSLCLNLGGMPHDTTSCLGVDCGGGSDEGACCLLLPGQPTCIVTSAQQCMHLAGSYQGDGTTCPENPMDPPPCEAPVLPCCLPSALPEGICVELPIEECFAQGGQPQSAPSCEFVQCIGLPPVGACCVNGGMIGCLIITQAECGKLGGEYLGDGSDCMGGPNEPPPCGSTVVPCCLPAPLPEGICLELPLEQCIAEGGQPHPAPSCDFVQCLGGPDQGACCIHLPGAPPCLVTSQAECEMQFQGVYQGDGTDCFNDPTHPPCGGPTLACCFDDGSCAEVTLETCLMANGTPHNSVSCMGVPCGDGPPVGACCVNGGGINGCIVVTQVQCGMLGGEYQGDGSDCNANPGAPPPCENAASACCLPDGSCVEVGSRQCIAQGGMPHNASCGDISCPGGGGIGACCINGGFFHHCLMLPQSECANLGGQYLGDGTQCSNDPTHPTCP